MSSICLSIEKDKGFINLSKILERKEGNLDAAERLVVRAQNVYPESTRIQLTYAEICELRGETKKVRDIFIKGSKSAEKYGCVPVCGAMWEIYNVLDDDTPIFREITKVIPSKR